MLMCAFVRRTEPMLALAVLQATHANMYRLALQNEVFMQAIKQMEIKTNVEEKY